MNPFWLLAPGFLYPAAFWRDIKGRSPLPGICSESNTPRVNPQLPLQISPHLEGKGTLLSFPFFSLLREAGDVMASSRSGNAADAHPPPLPEGLRLPVKIQLGIGAAARCQIILA